MSRWAFVVGDGGMEQFELKRGVSGRRVTWRLDAAADAGFTMRGTSPHAGAITEMVTDLHVYLDGTKVYRGRVGPTSDQLSSQGHAFTVSTADYRAWLERQKLDAGDQVAWVATDQMQIAWELVEEVQAHTGAAAGITEGLGPVSGVLRDRTYEHGQFVGLLIGDLGRVINGFEWEVDELLRLNRWYPQRGGNGGVVLDYGGAVASLDRQVNPADYYTAARVSGDSALVAEERVDPDIATRPEGRWDRQFGEPSITLQDTLSERADWLIGVGPVLSPAYVVTLRPDFWRGPEHFGVGDTVQLVIDSPPRLDVNTLVRVFEITVALNRNGRATVQVVLGAPRPDFGRRQANVSRRLVDLERR